jgi:hypothetical protein
LSEASTYKVPLLEAAFVGLCIAEMLHKYHELPIHHMQC